MVSWSLSARTLMFLFSPLSTPDIYIFLMSVHLCSQLSEKGSLHGEQWNGVLSLQVTSYGLWFWTDGLVCSISKLLKVIKQKVRKSRENKLLSSPRVDLILPNSTTSIWFKLFCVQSENMCSQNNKLKGLLVKKIEKFGR